MAGSIIVSGLSKKEKYESLLPQIQALVKNETNKIANLANIMAALKFGMDYLWVGIYFAEVSTTLTKEAQLVLGPFQGPVACTRIHYGKGVCGKSWELKQSIIVNNVDEFEGHIACHSLSRSEIVLPGFNKEGEVSLVLDVDSEHLAYFDETDQFYLEQVLTIIENL